MSGSDEEDMARYRYRSGLTTLFDEITPSMAAPENKRKNIPKSVRFEVLKRDKFTCQYCGAAAPEIVLHIDHINPVANEGDNDITNLITSCEGCNLGKSDRLLSDDTAVKKAKNQLDDLQERREQLEMMMDWQRGLRELAGDTVNELCTYWQEHAPGFVINDNGKQNIKKWLRTFSLEEIMKAMDSAAEQYLEYESNGHVTSDSWGIAFDKISGICRVTSQSKDDPDIRELYYIRGILRKRLSYFNDGQGLQLLKNARLWGVSVDTLRVIAYDTRSWTTYQCDIDDAIEETAAWKEEHATNVEQDGGGQSAIRPESN